MDRPKVAIGSFSEPLDKLVGESGFAAGMRERLFEEIYANSEMYKSKLRRMLNGNEADAEDAFQESVMNATRHLESFKGEANFATWFYRIVETTGLMRIRDGKEPPMTDADGCELADREPDVATRLERREYVAGLLSHAPEKYRQIWILRAYANLQEKELAEIYRTDGNTMRRRGFIGMSAIRKAIEEGRDPEAAAVEKTLKMIDKTLEHGRNAAIATTGHSAYAGPAAKPSLAGAAGITATPEGLAPVLCKVESMDRELVALRECAGLGNKELSGIYGLAPGAVDARICRSRAAALDAYRHGALGSPQEISAAESHIRQTLIQYGRRPADGKTTESKPLARAAGAR